MKKLRRLLAMMLTVVMCVGTIGDAGFTVFAADDEAAGETIADAEDEEAADAAVPASDEAVSEEETVTEDDTVDPVTDDGITAYELWVGDKQITSENKDSIPNLQGKYAEGSYDPETHTLKLEGVTGITNSHDKAKIWTSESLTIIGDAEISNNDGPVFTLKNSTTPGNLLTIEGFFSLEGKGDTNQSGVIYNNSGSVFIQKRSTNISIKANSAAGIYANGGIVLDGGKVEITGKAGLWAVEQDIKLNGGELNVKLDNSFETGSPIRCDKKNIDASAMDILEPSGGKVGSPNGYATIVDKDGKTVKSVHVKEKITHYGLWLGNVEVTSENADNIQGVQGDGAKAWYNPDNYTLSLLKVTGIEGDHEVKSLRKSQIYSTDTLKIYGEGAKLTGSDVVVWLDSKDPDDSLTFEGELDLTGNSADPAVNVVNGSLEVNGNSTDLKVKNKNAFGIYAKRGVTINAGTVSTEGGVGLGSQGVIQVNGGNVTAKSSNTEAIRGTGEAADLILAKGFEIIKPEQGSKKVSGSGAGRNVTVVDRFDKTAKEVQIGPEIKKYGLWIGDLEVTELNKDKIPNLEGSKASGTYDPLNKTLELHNVTGIKGMYEGYDEMGSFSFKTKIFATDDLTITGDATLENENGSVIFATSKTSSAYKVLTLKGDLNFKGHGSTIIYTYGNVVVNGADTDLSFKMDQVYAMSVKGAQGVIFYDGNVEMKGSAGLWVDNEIAFSGSDVVIDIDGTGSAIRAGKDIKFGEKQALISPEGAIKKKIKDDTGEYYTYVDSADKQIKKLHFGKDVERYDLWLGNTQVTEINKGDILGDGKASFDPETWTLTLNGNLAIAGGNDVTGIGMALIYSKHALNIEGNASFDTEYNAVVIIASDPGAQSTVKGNFSFLTAKRGIYSNSLVLVNGSDTTITMETADECIDCYVLNINDAALELNSKNKFAVLCTAALGLANCDLKAKGKVAAVWVNNTAENAIVFADGVEIIEPEGGKKAVEGAYTTIKDADDKIAEAVHIGIPATVLTVTVEAVDRVYESGKLDVELTNAELKGVESGDDVELDLSGATALMDDDKAGENKAVKISGIKLAGKDASKYVLKQPVGVTVNIKKAEWTLTKLSLVLEQEKIGTEIKYPIAPKYRPSGAYIEGVQAANGADQLDGDATVKSPTEISFKIKSGTELNDVDAWLLIKMTGADNYEDYILELSVVGKHEHTEDILELVEAVDAKCETPGVKEHYECKRCYHLFEKAGDTFKEVHESDLIVPALGHYLDDDIYDVLVYPTETTDGKARFHCQRSGCDYFEDKVLPKGTEVHRPSALNPVPENLDSAYTLTLVKGQKFNMPGSGWKSVDKNDKKYVSVSKKGAVKAKKATPEGVVSKMTNGSRTIEIKVIQPKFESSKTMKLEAKAVSEPVSCGFVPGDALVSVAYYSSSPDIVTVSDKGMLEAKTYGTATITAYVNGKAYNRKVKVTEPEPLKERKIHVNLNVKKNITIKGVKIKEWTVDDYAKEYVSIRKTQVTGKMAGEFTLNGKDKDDNLYRVTLIVDDPELKEPAFAPDKHKAGTYKYKLETEAGTVAFLKYVSMNQPLCFKSSNGSVAYVDEKLRLVAQNKGKCKLTAKINGKTVTINVKVN